MAWKYGNKTLKVNKAWKYEDNTQHPRQWVRWSSDRKSAMGVSWEDDTILGAFDDFYYYGWNSDGDALLPKPLAGLKVSKVNGAKQTSASMLSQTDWYVTRKTEANTAIPAEITAYRIAVRTNYTSLKTAINNASNIDELIACYKSITGASQTAKEINATSSSVVSTSNNTITSNRHGFVTDEQVNYNAGVKDNGDNAVVIGGLVHNTTYFIHSTTINTFKLSESHSNCGDSAVVSLTGLSNYSHNHTFTSQGKPGKGSTWPNSSMLKYDGS